MPGSVDFEALFNRSPNPYMLVDRDFRIVAANDAYLRATLSRREEAVGHNLFEAFPGGPDGVESAGARQVQASLERVLTEREPDTLALVRYPMAVKTPDGVVYEDRYWSATHTPIFDDAGGVRLILQHTVDVTELQRLKKALRAAEVALDTDLSVSQVEEGVFRRAQVVQEQHRRLDAEHRRLRRLFEQAPGFFAVLSGEQHVFEMANRAYFQVIGHREILGRPVKEALPEVAGQGFYELLDEVYASGEPYVGREMAVYLERQAGAPLVEVFADFVYQPIIEPDGSISGIFVQGHDVTEQKRARDALQELNETLEKRIAERTAELEARNRELQEFAYVASHDLQEPLRKVNSFVDLLTEEYGDAEGQAAFFIERIRHATRRMSRLIKDLLAYSRVATQGGTFEPVDLNEVVADVVSDLQVRVEETGGHVEVGDLPTLEADPVQMRQLFLNLIGNALKFHRPDVPPVVQVRGRIASEAGDAAAPPCRIEVADNGIGFEEAYHERIFLPFQRLHSRDRFAGTGIGLAICRRIVERHGGTIVVQSTPGEGTTFGVHLPLRRDGAAAAG